MILMPNPDSRLRFHLRFASIIFIIVYRGNTADAGQLAVLSGFLFRFLHHVPLLLLSIFLVDALAFDYVEYQSRQSITEPNTLAYVALERILLYIYVCHFYSYVVMSIDINNTI